MYPMSVPQSELAPNYFLHTFANGLQIVGQRMPSLASVTFGVQFAAGIKDEPEEKLGLTHLLSDMVFQGTESRNVRQLTDEFEAIGARRGGETGNEFAREQVAMQVLDGDFAVHAWHESLAGFGQRRVVRGIVLRR